MERKEIDELHYITPIGNVASILAYEILSHHYARLFPHRSVAMPEIQERRKGVRVRDERHGRVRCADVQVARYVADAPGGRAPCRLAPGGSRR